MQGSLDNPPIVITMSRGKMVLLLLIAMMFTIGGGLMIAHKPDDLTGYLCAGFFGLGIPVFIWRFLSPPRLEISPRGISWFTGHKTLEYAWKDFAGFRAYRPSSRNLSKYVGFEYARDSAKRGKMTAVAHALAGVDGGLGGQWEMPAEKLVDLLNQAKQRWGR